MFFSLHLSFTPKWLREIRDITIDVVFAIQEARLQDFVRCEMQKGPFKTESCKRCKFNTTQLFLETKTVRKLCLNCLDFNEKRDTLIQTEIFFCAKCCVLMEISCDGVYFICPHCFWMKEKTFFLKQRKRPWK